MYMVRVFNLVTSFIVAFAMLVPQPVYFVVYAQAPNPPLSVDLGADQTVRSSQTFTITATTTGTNTPDAELTVSWSADLDFFRLRALSSPDSAEAFSSPILTSNDLALTLTAPSLSADFSFNLNITVTDPNAAAGQTPVTDQVFIEILRSGSVLSAPTFTNIDSFSSTISTNENQQTVGTEGFFITEGSNPIEVTLAGTDGDLFRLSDAGTLSFNTPPNFELPRGEALSPTNTNDYTLTISAVNSVGTTPSGPINVRVINVNDAPTAPTSVTTGDFTEHSQGTFNYTATDEDTPTQTLRYALVAPAYGATISNTGAFIWTPREDDGGQAREFTVAITDDGTPPQTGNGVFSITAIERNNRSPTNAVITTLGDATSVTNPADLVVSATAEDLDNETLTYAWSVPVGSGTFAPATGASVTWSPPTVETATTHTLTVTAADPTGASVTDTHDILVNPEPPNTVPAFATGVSIPNQIYFQATTIESLILPVATGGNGAITYTLVNKENLPTGLIFEGATNPPTLTGKPTTSKSTTEYIYTATDADLNTQPDDAATLTFTITVQADTSPKFHQGANVPNQIFLLNTPITPVILPSLASTGNGANTYSVAGLQNFPGLEFDPATLRITGTPTAVSPSRLVSYIVIDSDDNGSLSDIAFLQFHIRVNAEANVAPTDVVITTAGGVTEVTNPNTLVLTATASDPDSDTLTYSWSQNFLHIGGSFSPETGSSVTWTPPTIPAGVPATTIAVIVTVTDGSGGSATARYPILVNPSLDTAPSFGGASVPDQTYTINMPIMPFELPSATGGNGDLTYAISPPPGLEFNPATRVLSGTPATLDTAGTVFTYSVTDSDDNRAGTDAATLSFSITVTEGGHPYDFTQNGSVTQSDGLVFYLLASGVSVAATSIVVEREGNSNIRNAPADALNALKAVIDNNDLKYDFTQNGSVTQSDGLVFYLLASGISVAATSIVVEREGNSNIRNAPADALNALKAAIEN